ncbi:MAG: 50S ribosomal protein L30 [Anaerolineales bacterium]
MTQPERTRRSKKQPARWLRVTLRKSAIGCSPRHRATLWALGLHRRLHAVQLADTPQVRGMVQTVSHLVEVEPASGDTAKEKRE